MTTRAVFFFLLICTLRSVQAQVSLGVSAGTNLTFNNFSHKDYPHFFQPGIGVRGVVVAEVSPVKRWALRAEWGTQIRAIQHKETVEGKIVTDHFRRYDLTFMESSVLLKWQPFNRWPVYIMGGGTFAQLQKQRRRLVPALPVADDPYDYNSTKIDFARRQWFTDFAAGHRWQVSTNWYLATEARCQVGLNNFSRRRSERGIYRNFGLQATAMRTF
jgi:hypothetical protein